MFVHLNICGVRFSVVQKVMTGILAYVVRHDFASTYRAFVRTTSQLADQWPGLSKNRIGAPFWGKERDNYDYHLLTKPLFSIVPYIAWLYFCTLEGTLFSVKYLLNINIILLLHPACEQK